MKTSITKRIATLAVLAGTLMTTAAFGYGGSNFGGSHNGGKSGGSSMSSKFSSMMQKSGYGGHSNSGMSKKSFPGSNSPKNSGIVFNSHSQKIVDMQNRMGKMSSPYGGSKHSNGVSNTGFKGWGDKGYGSVPAPGQMANHKVSSSWGGSKNGHQSGPFWGNAKMDQSGYGGKNFPGSDKMFNHKNGPWGSSKWTSGYGGSKFNKSYWSGNNYSKPNWGHVFANYASNYCYPSHRPYCYPSYRPYCYPTYTSYSYPRYQTYCEPTYCETPVYPTYSEPAYCEPTYVEPSYEQAYCEPVAYPQPYCEPVSYPQPYCEPTYAPSNFEPSYDQGGFAWNGNCVERF